MRIISGTSKGRRLAPLRGHSIRPTSDRIKESIFNILGTEVEGKVVLDLFAGTGNLGIEALSRGARQTIFVERAREALRTIQRNLLQCGFSEQAEVIPKEVNRTIGLLEARSASFDLILMDPPYEEGWVERTLLKLNCHNIYHEGSILVIEHSRREPLPQKTGNWTLLKQKRIGDTMISILQAGQNPLGGKNGTEKERR
jgi:16S rRNA (guanine966-N2)-methyltransferase